MNEALLNEFKSLLKIFTECGASISDDMKTLDCTSPKTVSDTLLPSLAFKVKKLQECVATIHKICKSLKKEDLKCLPCCKSSLS